MSAGEWHPDDYAWLAPVHPDGGNVAWRCLDPDDEKPWVDQMGNVLTDDEMTARGAVLLVRDEMPAYVSAAGSEVREEWGVRYGGVDELSPRGTRESAETGLNYLRLISGVEGVLIRRTVTVPAVTTSPWTEVPPVISGEAGQ